MQLRLDTEDHSVSMDSSCSHLRLLFLEQGIHCNFSEKMKRSLLKCQKYKSWELDVLFLFFFFDSASGLGLYSSLPLRTDLFAIFFPNCRNSPSCPSVQSKSETVFFVVSLVPISHCMATRIGFSNSFLSSSVWRCSVFFSRTYLTRVIFENMNLLLTPGLTSIFSRVSPLIWTCNRD